jgi:two-component system sensor histidine kinase YesM
MRYSLKSREVVSMQEEMQISRQYLMILQRRFPGRFSVVIDVPECLLEKKLIKMSLQPLIENAVYHGFENVENGGEIRLKAVEKEDRLLFSVEDNGEGIPPEKLAALNEAITNEDQNIFSTENESKGIGLLNIARRIKMVFGRDYGITIQSDSGRTCITLRLPLSDTIPIAKT